MGRIEGLCTKCKEFHWDLTPYNWDKNEPLKSEFLCDYCYAHRSSCLVMLWEDFVFHIKELLRKG